MYDSTTACYIYKHKPVTNCRETGAINPSHNLFFSQRK